MLPQIVIDAMRSGVPIVGAMVGPSVARERGRQVSNLKQVAAYSFGGWLAGYVLQRVVFWGLDNIGQRSLPTEVSSLKGFAHSAPPPMPRPEQAPQMQPPVSQPVPKPKEKAEVQNDGVRVVDEADNVVPMKIQSHMRDAYGSEL
jgi:alpha/beta superfamily hydrolase